MKAFVLQLGLILSLCTVLPVHAQEPIRPFDPEYFETQRFAHRGGYAFGTENTISTILHTLALNITSIEIDIQMTKDGTLILFHDQTIERILATDQRMKVSDLSLEEIRQIPLRAAKSSESVNTLFELLDTLAVVMEASKARNFLLELDFKPHGKAAEVAVEKIDHLFRRYEDRYGEQIYDHFFVSSFYPEVLKALHRKNRKVKTAFAVNHHPVKNKLASKMAILMAPSIMRKYDVDILEPHLCMVTEKFVRKWHSRGVMINAYTANTPCEKNYLEQFRIAYTTNCPGEYCEGDPSDALGKPTNWCKECTTKGE